MAQISATELFRFENFNPKLIGMTVGNNRAVSHTVTAHTDKDGVTRVTAKSITGSLHGHPVFELRKLGTTDLNDERYSLTIDTCGYMTSTTRSAMQDFLRASGLNASVSIAGGELQVSLIFKDTGGRHQLRTHAAKDGHQRAFAYLSKKCWAEFNTLHTLA